MLKSSIFNQPHFFKIKIKDSGVLNFPFFKMNHFFVCMHVEGGRDVKNLDFLQRNNP